MGDNDFGIDPKRIAEYAEEIKAVANKGVQVGIVIGGGNIFRGISGASQGHKNRLRCTGRSTC